MWYHCYHSKRYPVINFVHIDDAIEIKNESVNESFQEAPNANSTAIGSVQRNHNQTIHSSRTTSHNPIGNSNSRCNDECQSVECSSYSVGHVSHIPRTPPTPGTYTIPKIFNKSIGTEKNDEDIFGMIKLKDTDVCYTSGTIEWVGRKRSFPINSGFKILNKRHSEPAVKIKRLNKTYTKDIDGIRECECADVLPTVNAIVDHLNALHEAVDLVDLRLSTLENTITKND